MGAVISSLTCMLDAQEVGGFSSSSLAHSFVRKSSSLWLSSLSFLSQTIVTVQLKMVNYEVQCKSIGTRWRTKYSSSRQKTALKYLAKRARRRYTPPREWRIVLRFGDGTYVEATYSSTSSSSYCASGSDE